MALLNYQEVPEHWDAFFAEQRNTDLPEAMKLFYLQALPEAQQTLQETNFVALDIETTGLNAQTDDIVSIGIVPFDVHRIYLSKAKHWIVRPRKLTTESVLVHGITHTDVAEAPSFKSVLPEILTHLQGKQVVVHYRYMEREFFRIAVQKLFKQNLLFPVIDTLELEAQFLRNSRSIFDKLRNKTMPSLRLLNVRERYNLPAYENHNALVDALATAELLQAQLAKQQLHNKLVRNVWL
ncbi:3'-5' exonuclease [Reinekea marina]|uniref:DNA-directed DNA polymerase n=1 Tax=Reinekea marina TaxID=1310421 RepID=A0ABV7WXP0_9GAMM|nr:3'-5' exonuclease [Reinekea marina]MDN3647431.1 3'-5' exonuclease [Reinekea marina]